MCVLTPGLYCSILPTSFLYALMTNLVPKCLGTRLFQYTLRQMYKLASIYIRAGATSPVGQILTGPLFSASALTADLGEYDVRGSIDEVREVLS